MTTVKDFLKFQSRVSREISLALATVTRVYRTSADPVKLWQLYLGSLSPQDNPLFRERTEHDCVSCRHFIQRYGGLVVIKTDTHETRPVLDIDVSDTGYQNVIDALVAYVKTCPITEVFLSRDQVLGTPENVSQNKKTGAVEVWKHLSFKLPKSLVFPGPKDMIDTQLGKLRTDAQCLERALTELTREAVDEVIELIRQGTLYRGESWLSPLETFSRLMAGWAASSNKANFAWASASTAPEVARIRNSSIGTLLVDLSGGMDLEDAVRRYEAVTAPANYQRPTALVTPAMVEKARLTIEGLGVLDSLPHRHARLEDITVQNVLFANRAVKSVESAKLRDPLSELSASLPQRKQMTSKAEPIACDKFRDNVMPGCTSLDVYVEPTMAPNLVSLLAPVNPGAPRLFKWDNGFCWAYAGNLADSDMKRRVKAHGGNVTGVLRFSIQWNEDGRNQNDLDAHCLLPYGAEISFRAKSGHRCGGNLDVDIITPGREPAVENITWPELRRMTTGPYGFFVECYSGRGGTGFSAEVEFEGKVYAFRYDKSMHSGQRVPVATVQLQGDGSFTIEPSKAVTATSMSGRAIWGLTTPGFHPVTAVMHSPNYWDGQDGHGHRHVFFMLHGCVNDESPNAFYNEYLRGEFTAHRKVFEALGGKMKVEPDANQLSGVGFSTTKRSVVVVRARGQTERIFAVQF